MSVSEPPPPSDPELQAARYPAWAVALGAFCGLVLAVVASAMNFFGGLAMLSGFSQVGCGQAAVAGAIEVALAVGVAALAWWAVRRKDPSFGGYLLRGATVVMAIYLLAPWPCSFTGGAYIVVTSCRH